MAVIVYSFGEYNMSIRLHLTQADLSDRSYITHDKLLHPSIKIHTPHHDLSDRSFITQGDELIAPSIGLSNNGIPISCRLNYSRHDCKYGLSAQDAIATICAPQTNLKKWVFQKIQKHTNYQRQYINSIFLPNAIQQGDYSAMSKFLQNLRSNKVNSYVKLNLQESRGHFNRNNKPIPSTSNLILEELDHISSIDNKDSESEEGGMKYSKSSLINVSYVEIKVNQEQLDRMNELKDQNSQEMSSAKKTNSSRMGVPLLDLNFLINTAKVKKYQFKRTNLTGSQTQRKRIRQNR